MNEHLRQTGRTTRMIQEACRLAACGFAVYILTETRNEAKLLAKRVDEAWYHYAARSPGQPNGIKVETPGDLGNWHWERMELVGAHPNVKVLIDHNLAEHRIEALQREMKRIAAEIAQLYPMTV